MKKILIIINAILLIVIFSSISNAQTHCTRSKVFVAEMNTTMKLKGTGAPMLSAGIGVSGIYGKGTILDNMTAIAGVRSIVTREPSKPSNDRLTMLPTATIMYRLRLNGEDSRTVHSFAWITGKNYTGFEYRPYMAPTERSFAVIGGIVGWNNVSGWNVGISVLGLF